MLRLAAIRRAATQEGGDDGDSDGDCTPPARERFAPEERGEIAARGPEPIRHQPSGRRTPSRSRLGLASAGPGGRLPIDHCASRKDSPVCVRQTRPDRARRAGVEWARVRPYGRQRCLTVGR